MGQREGAGDQAVQDLLLRQGRVQQHLSVEQAHGYGDADVALLQLAQAFCEENRAWIHGRENKKQETRNKKQKQECAPELTATVSRCSTGWGSFVSHRAATCAARKTNMRLREEF
eukprot:Colp12_sorted_trinity150504_noHs@33380